MKILLKRPSARDSGKLGLAAYEVISFRHHPSDTDPRISCCMADGRRLELSGSGGALDRIIEGLLTPDGIADCRDIPGINLKIYDPCVQIGNKSVPVTIKNEAVPVTIEDEVVPIAVTDEVIPVTMVDEVMPVTVEDQSLPVYVINEPLKIVNPF